MKKYLRYVLLLFFMIIVTFSTIKAKTTLPLIGKLIVIDPGHGSLDPGTVYNNIYEKDINLKISLELKNMLEQNGASVIMTRDGDYDLSSPNAMFRKKSDFDNRIKLINNSGADLYLSIHLNFLSDSSYYGPQVFYKKEDINLAEILQNSLNDFAKSNRNIKLMPSDTYMYKHLIVSGALIECGFLSNSYERQKLLTTKYQHNLANAISDALIIYFT